MRYYLNTLPPPGGYSADPAVFGSNRADRRGWEGDAENLLFAQGTSLSGQFARQWKLRVAPLEAASKGMADSELRRKVNGPTART